MEKDDFTFYRQLEREAASWVGEGLISPEQKGRILARYQRVKRAEEKAGPGKLVTTLSILGSVLVGVGVILFIASNWSAIPKEGKLAIIFVSMLASYGAGYYIRYEKENYPKVGAALILLGAIIFGAGIFLIAQIYHITVHFPNGPLMWGLGVLPLAYLLRLKTLLSLAIIDLLVWLGWEASYELSSWTGIGNLTSLFTLYLMAGLLLWSLGLAHRWFDRWKNISGAYLVLGVFVTALAAYLMTFNLYRHGLSTAALLPFYIGIIALFLLFAVVSLFSSQKETGWIPEMLALCGLMAGAFYLACYIKGTVHTADTIRLTVNLVFALGIVGLIILGYIRRCPAYINIGLLFFILDVIARYFDFFWELLPRSLFFIIGGILLLVGGVLLERKRRQVLAAFKI